MKVFNLKLLTLMVVVASFLSSCVGYRSKQSIRSASMHPSRVELKTTLEDYKLLGIEEVSVSYKKYFGIFTVMNEINGQETSIRNVNIVNFNGINPVFDRRLKLAVFAGLAKHPDVEFIVPISVVTETDKMFMGRNVKKTLRFKMYKLNDK